MNEQSVEKAALTIPVFPEDRNERRASYLGVCPGCGSTVTTERSRYALLVEPTRCPGCACRMNISKEGL